jgi:hypothetical protein
MINSLELFQKKKDAKGVTRKWLETRRSYLDKLKLQAEMISGHLPEVISEYADSNQSLYRRVWFKESEENFVKRCLSAKVVLCGDFHSSQQIKRFYGRFFKSHKGSFKSKKTAFALECFDEKHDVHLQAWLEDKISESDLLEKTKWAENWGFSWQAYKKIILKLHSFGFGVRAVNNGDHDFYARDRKIAKKLLKLGSEYDLVFCLIGQHHLGPDNLPKAFSQLNEPEPVCLHLDAEELYFALEEYNLLKDVQILNLENHYCFLSTPPWVHWQNHLLYLEGYQDDDDDIDDDFDEIRGEDYNLVVYEYTQLIKRDLGITDKTKAIDVAFIDDYVVQGKTDRSRLHEIMAPMLESETSFYWPEQYEGIMVKSSLNQAAAVAGKYLHASMMGVTSLPWGDTKSFEVWSWLEAVGYMLSKFINPKRSTVSAHNVSAFLSARLGKDKAAKILKVLLRERILELDQRRDMVHSVSLNWAELVYAARLKGALIGEGLFELYSRELISPETMRTYLSVSIEKGERFKAFYDLVLGRLDLKFDRET